MQEPIDTGSALEHGLGNQDYAMRGAYALSVIALHGRSGRPGAALAFRLFLMNATNATGCAQSVTQPLR